VDTAFFKPCSAGGYPVRYVCIPINGFT